MSDSPTKTPPPSPSSWSVGATSEASSSQQAPVRTTSFLTGIPPGTTSSLTGIPLGTTSSIPWGTMHAYIPPQPPRSIALRPFSWPQVLPPHPTLTPVPDPRRVIGGPRARQVLISRDGNITLPTSLVTRVRHITQRLGRQSDYDTIERLIREAEYALDSTDASSAIPPRARSRSPPPR